MCIVLLSSSPIKEDLNVGPQFLFFVITDHGFIIISSPLHYYVIFF